MADHPESAWTAILDGMEADLTRKVDLTQSGAWSPPANAGPLPEHLADRARQIVDAQQRAIASLADDHKSVGRHLAALRTVPSTLPEGQSVYLDVIG
ncbi:MAG: hypothetical protein ABW091_02150 [Microbacterium sp.]